MDKPLEKEIQLASDMLNMLKRASVELGEGQTIHPKHLIETVIKVADVLKIKLQDALQTTLK